MAKSCEVKLPIGIPVLGFSWLEFKIFSISQSAFLSAIFFLIIFNKIDLVQGNSFAFLKKQLKGLYPDSIFLSTFTREGFDDLLSQIKYFISEQQQTRRLIIPEKLDSLLNFVRDNSTIHEEYYDEKNKQHKLDVKINDTIYKDIVLQLERYQMLEYINS